MLDILEFLWSFYLQLSWQKHEHSRTKAVLSFAVRFLSCSACFQSDSWGAATFFSSLLFITFYANPWKAHIKMPHKKKHAYWRRCCFHSDLSSSNNYTKHTRVRPYLPSTCMADNITMTTEQGDTRQARKIAVDTQVLPLRGSWLAQIILREFVVFLWEFE